MTALHALSLNVPDHAFLALLDLSCCADLCNLEPIDAQKSHMPAEA